MRTTLDTDRVPPATVRIARVMVAFDGSPSSLDALEVALDEADRRSVPLEVRTAVDLDPVLPQEYARMSGQVAAAVGAAVTAAGRRLGAARVTSSVAAGAPSAVVLQAVRPGDLVVLGSRSHRLLARAVLGSTSTYVATHAHVPVMVVRHRDDHQARPGERVVVGVDGSAGSAAATRHAAEEAVLRGLPLRAVLVLAPSDRSAPFTGPDDPGRQEAGTVLAEALAGLAVDHPDLRVEPVVAQGPAVDALLEHGRGARLLVVGSRGRGPLTSALLGSVSRDLLHRAGCDVTVVR